MNHPDPNTPGAAHEAELFDALPLCWLLLGESIIFFLAPVGLLLLIWLLAGLMLRRWDGTLVQALTTGLQIGSIVFGASAVLWAGLAGWAFMQGDDPWEALPGITPPYLDNFLARYPALSVSTFGGTHWLILHNADAQSVYLDGDDLVDAQVRFQPCPSSKPARATLPGTCGCSRFGAMRGRSTSRRTGARGRGQRKARRRRSADGS